MRIESDCVSRPDRGATNGWVQVDQVVQARILEVQAGCRRRRIEVSLDLAPVRAQVDREQLDWAVGRLVDQAIDRMPSGGELSITLVETRFQWELEVADSAPTTERVWFHDSGKPAGAALVRVIPIIHNDLEAVHELASQWNGTVQSWICPQGGTAHILVVPHRVATARAA